MGAVLLALLILAGSASAATVTFGMRSTDNYTGDWKDTHVRAMYPNTNDYSGTYGRLVPEDQYIHYLVNISALPEGAEIMSAKLHFNVHSNYKDNGSFNVELRSLGKNFTETGDTWNQADKQAGVDWTNNNGGESDSSSAYGEVFLQKGSGGWKEVSFNFAGTTYLNQRLASDGNVYLMLFPTMDWADCGTTGCMRVVPQSEWTADQSQRPYLEVTYTTGGAECDDTDERQCGTTDMGECEYGIETCTGGAWGSCVGEKGPVAETCDGKDNDCDGSTDENGVCTDCTEGETQQCGSTDKGPCEYGTQTCTNGTWGACSGGVNPGTETCGNGIDEDCDGADSECGTGTTYYVCGNIAECNSNGGQGWSGTPSNGNSCLTKADSCLTVQGGIKKMSANDTLIIGNGYYTGHDNRVEYVPSGSGGPYGVDGSTRRFTIVKAENPFRVVLDGSHKEGYEIMLYLGQSANRSYIHIDGIIIFRGVALFNGTDHIWVTRCGFGEAEPLSEKNQRSNFVMHNSEYNLVEDCFAFGEARYKMAVGSAGKSHNIIFRRNISRYDFYYDNYGGIGNFCNYTNDNVIFQNAIAIDGLEFQPDPTHYYRPPGFINSHGLKKTVIDGSMVLNIYGQGIFSEGLVEDGMPVTNTVFWDIKTGGDPRGYAVLLRTDNGLSSFRNITSGNTNINMKWYVMDMQPPERSLIENTIFYGYTGDAAKGANQSFNVDYGLFYNNVNDGKTGSNPIFNKNPLENGLMYLPRIEEGSYLYTAGKDDGIVGATILNQIGVSGTFYGDPGWDTVTNIPLWPYPNELEIMGIMCDNKYNDHLHEFDIGGRPIDFNRGFCLGVADKYGGPRTLTSYIWEYLGNTCPHESPGDPCYYDVLPCANGEITEGSCLCGGQEYEDGYCCSGSWQATECMQECGEGEITGECYCGGEKYDNGDGYCCSGQQQEEECGFECTPACTLSSECAQFQCCKNAGTCEAECVMSTPGLMNYINEWKVGELTLSEIIEKVADWKANGSSCI